MTLGFLYWHWLIFGAVLVIAELMVPSFTLMWFGLGGFVVAIGLWMMPSIPFSVQLLIWGLSSVLFTLAWFTWIKPRMIDRTKAGIALEAVVGESGMVIDAPAANKRGIVRFTTPLLGDDEWPFICEDPLSAGDRVFVKDVSGNTLIVEKKNR